MLSGPLAWAPADVRAGGREPVLRAQGFAGGEGTIRNSEVSRNSEDNRAREQELVKDINLQETLHRG